MLGRLHREYRRCRRKLECRVSPRTAAKASAGPRIRARGESPRCAGRRGRWRTRRACSTGVGAGG